MIRYFEDFHCNTLGQIKNILFQVTAFCHTLLIEEMERWWQGGSQVLRFLGARYIFKGAGFLVLLYA